MLDKTLTCGKCANYHSTSGMIAVSDVGDNGDWFGSTIKNSFNEKKYNSINDINCGGPQTGYANIRMYVNNGQKETVAHSCLTKLKDNSNFVLMKNTLVKNIIISKSDKGIVTVNGVNVHTSEADCSDFSITANHEIILSAGAESTAKILLQSGIGRAKDLCPNTKQVLDLNVGYNRIDHIRTVHFYIIPESNNPPEVQIVNVTARLAAKSEKYLKERKGYYSTFDRSNLQLAVNLHNKSSAHPDIIYNFMQYDQCTPEFNMTCKNYGYKQEFCDQLYRANQYYSLLVVTSTLQEPKSSGTVKLGSCCDPLAYPTINTNYLTEQHDIEMLIKGIEELNEFMNTTTMINNGVKDLMINITECNAFKRNSEDYYRCYIKYFSNGDNNVCGTAKMGRYYDKDAVVDYKMRVMNVTKYPNTANLRIVDASIFPTITMGNSPCVSFAVAEKAADLIINDRLPKYSEERRRNRRDF
ncbi:hypothetical protein PVAND_001681 [Polypedilum vanderplanki]|uniref:Uncharacterized protein n=1 Tax=Polypedilum vanderplanki TaxID=319348 RepID=A0A9J6BP39_POLVA|nr:hypothetical protein PVAND_001681 [Polypedilum vanderplanki]